MARIRTIKPEFPQSESMGRVSREARLLFIQLWTICDDFGRGRGSSRMLASLLYPYDEDATDLIDGWMAELEREGCVVRYIGHDEAAYYASPNWDKHQKVDRPSKSKIPAPTDANTREYASRARESLAKVSVGPRTKDQGPKEGTKDQEVPLLRNGADAHDSSSPIAQGSGADSLPTDPKTWLFTAGRLWVQEASGRPESAIRPLLGKWLKALADDACRLKVVIERAMEENPADPVTWIIAAVKNRATQNPQPDPQPPPGDPYHLDDDDLFLAKIFGGDATDTLLFKRGLFQEGWPFDRLGPPPHDPKCKIDPVVLSRHGYRDGAIYAEWRRKNGA